MNFSEYKYIDIAIDGANNRNKITNIVDFKIPIGQKDCYRTIFRFDENYLRHFEKNNTVSQFKGKCYADWLPFDIDDNDLETAHKKTKEAVEILRLDYDIDVVYLFFSGAKGFHILLPSEIFGIFIPANNLPMIFKNIANEMIGEISDLSIYEINRLFRLVNTINSKTGLYKVPLTRQEFDSGIGKIREIAKKPRDLKFQPMFDNIVNNQLIELYEKHKNEKDDKLTSEFFKKTRDGVKEGERDVFTTKLVGLLHSKGLTQDATFEIICGWNKGNNPPLEEKQIIKIINSVYKYKTSDDELQRNIYPIWSVFDEYKEYASAETKVNLGIPEIDKKIRGIRPGQVMTILGYTGNFKSALLQNLLRHYMKYSGEPVLMFELEMSRLDLFERAVQMEFGYEGGIVEEIFKDQDKKMAEGLIHDMQVRQKDFYVVDLPALSFEEMCKYVRIAEEKVIRRKIGLVGIDFLQLMSGIGNTRVNIMDYIAKELKNFAKKIYVPVIAISQTTDVEDENSVIKLMNARDSKTIPQMSDYVLGIWLKENRFHIQILKNRKGGLGYVEHEIDRKNLNFIDL